MSLSESTPPRGPGGLGVGISFDSPTASGHSRTGGGGGTAMSPSRRAIQRINTGDITSDDVNAVAKLLTSDEMLEEKARQVRHRTEARQRLRQSMTKIERRSDRIREMFETFDIDGNGTIDEIEFASVVKFLRIPIAPEDLTTTFDSIDIDGTGSISEEEFSTWYNGEGKAMIKSNSMQRLRLNMKAMSAAGRKKRDRTIAKFELLREAFTQQRIAAAAKHEEEMRRAKEKRQDEERLEALRRKEAEERERLTAELQRRTSEIEEAAAKAAAATATSAANDEQDANLDSLSNSNNQPTASDVGLEAAREANSKTQGRVGSWIPDQPDSISADDVRHILSRGGAVPISCLALQLQDPSTTDSPTPFRLHVAFQANRPNEASSLAAVAKYCTSTPEAKSMPLVVLLKLSCGFADGVFQRLDGDDTTASTGTGTESSGVGAGAGETSTLGSNADGSVFAEWGLICHVPQALPEESLARFLLAYQRLIADPEVRPFLPRGCTGAGPPFLRDFVNLAQIGAFNTDVNGAGPGDGGLALRQVQVAMAMRTTPDDATANAVVFERESALLQINTSVTVPSLVSAPHLETAHQIGSVVVLCGPNGVGKKTLATTYARLASASFPMGVFPLRVANSFQVETSVRCLLQTHAGKLFSDLKFVATTSTVKQKSAKGDNDEEKRATDAATPGTESADIAATIASLQKSADTAVGGFQYSNYSPAEARLLRHLHTSAGWLLILIGVQSASSLREYLQQRQLLALCRTGAGCVIATCAGSQSDREFLREMRSKGEQEFAHVVGVESLTKQEGVAYLLANTFIGARRVNGSEAVRKAEADSLKTICRTAKKLVKFSRGNVCALKLCLAGIGQVLQQQARKDAGDEGDDDSEHGSKDGSSFQAQHQTPPAIASAYNAYTRRLEDAARSASDPSKGTTGASMEISTVMAANMALLKERFPKLWKQHISLFFQLCSAIDATFIHVALVESFAQAAAKASSGAGSNFGVKAAKQLPKQVWLDFATLKCRKHCYFRAWACT